MKPSIYKKRDDIPMFLSVIDVANLLGISRANAYELVRAETFPKLRLFRVSTNETVWSFLTALQRSRSES